MTKDIDIKQMRDAELYAAGLREIRENFEALPKQTRSAFHRALDYIDHQPVADQSKIIEILLRQLEAIDDIRKR